VAVLTGERPIAEGSDSTPAYLLIALRSLFEAAEVAGIALIDVQMRDSNARSSLSWSGYRRVVRDGLPCVSQRDWSDGLSPAQLASVPLEQGSGPAHQNETIHYAAGLGACAGSGADAVLIMQDDAMLLPELVSSDLRSLLAQLPGGLGGGDCLARRGACAGGGWAFLRLLYPPHLQGTELGRLPGDVLVIVAVAAAAAGVAALLRGAARWSAALTRMRQTGTKERGAAAVRGRRRLPAAAGTVLERWLDTAARVRVPLVTFAAVLGAGLALYVALDRVSFLLVRREAVGARLAPAREPAWGNVANVFTPAGAGAMAGRLFELARPSSVMRYRMVDLLVNDVADAAALPWFAPEISLAHHLGIVSSLPDMPVHGARQWMLDHAFYEPLVRSLAE